MQPSNDFGLYYGIILDRFFYGAMSFRMCMLLEKLFCSICFLSLDKL